MARYEHLPIYRDAYDLTVHIEQIVRSFSRYHKYTLGTELRNKMRAVLERVIEANMSNIERRSSELTGLGCWKFLAKGGRASVPSAGVLTGDSETM
jgi:hypothetical protein